MDPCTTGLTSTSTIESKTVIIITSCHDDVCMQVPITTGVTVITEEYTTYITYCPLSTEAATDSANNKNSVEGTVGTRTKVGTTIVTITSCVNDKCTLATVTTGVVTFTENDTVYTTYCSLPTTATTATGTGGSNEDGVSTTKAHQTSSGSEGRHQSAKESGAVTNTTAAASVSGTPKETKTSSTTIAAAIETRYHH
ncbi:PGA62 [Candida margitis]|uniref:PGA62 n=1 Tax=Candida margitis TaxID=1775924 RepID=UPI002226F2F5|nr:PGA62 [Candida margitis]KAI5970809.1 PGA62 [Candida margitis]